MQFKDLLYTTTIAREESFSRAAQKLFVSQPALSQAVARLERELGQKLFIREGNRIRLTTIGKIFVTDGAEILRLSEQLEKKLTDMADQQKRELRLGISSFYSEHYLGKILPAFRALYPYIELRLLEDVSYNLEEHVLSGAVDFCMVPLPLAHELDYQVLHVEEIFFAVPPETDLTGRSFSQEDQQIPLVNLQAFASEPFISLKKQRFAEMGLDLCREAGFEPNILYETTNWNTVSALISNGMGVGFLPGIMTGHLPPNVSGGPLFCRITRRAKITRLYVAAYKKGSQLSATAQNFIRISQETLAD